jgi:hypothetical protein
MTAAAKAVGEGKDRRWLCRERRQAKTGKDSPLADTRYWISAGLTEGVLGRSGARGPPLGRGPAPGGAAKAGAAAVLYLLLLLFSFRTGGQAEGGACSVRKR